MIGRRHSGLRLIIPPSATSHPTRVQCKLINAVTKLSCPPPLSEAEALAARVLDFGPTRVKFDRLVHQRQQSVYLSHTQGSTFFHGYVK